jgi:glycosyltransferase involved in cell wall biosynthesis
MTPLVSICLLTMNHEKYVLQCLQSLKDQDYPNLEVVYVDNFSADRTYEITVDFLENWGIPFTAEKRERSYSAANNGKLLFAKANGKYVCGMSGDDWMTEKSISKKVKRLMEDDQLGLVYSNCYLYFDETGETITDDSSNKHEGYVFDQLLISNFIVSPGFILDLEKVKAIGSYNENVVPEDWDLLLRMAKKYKIAFINECLVYYRRHANNASFVNDDRYIRNKLGVIQQYSDHKNYNIAKRNIIESWIVDAVHNDPSAKTFKFLLHNFRLHPFYIKQLLKLSYSILFTRKTIKNPSLT